MNYRVRAYVVGQGEVCCASAASYNRAQDDVRKLQRSFPHGLLAVIEKRDAKAFTGWAEVERTN
jgi:hypothetical protein